MASYYRVYVSSADASTQLSSNATYSVVRNATNATNTLLTTVALGQRWSGTAYNIQQYFPIFDTSTIPSDKTSANLSIKTSTTPDAGNSADQLEVRAVSSSANKIAGGSLSAQTPLFGTAAHPPAFARINIALDITSMARTATCRMLVHSQNERLNVAPTALEGTPFFIGDQTGTVDDPYLDIAPATAWEFVGVSAVAEATATSLTLTMPAGVADGDLLVACIALRTTSTTSLSNTGWTLVNEQKTNNILTTGSAVASGCMFYQIRAGASDVSFALPAGSSVALGRIVAYRNVDTASPLDVSTAFTTAISTLAVSGAGLTTTQDDDLIVAMCAGGQEALWSAFNATDPASASGSTDTTSAPAPVWIERADSVTTTGTDTSLGIFDAVKSSAGATGNLTATASVAAAHVVIAGAFKIAAAATTGTGTPSAQASDTDGAGISSSVGSGTPASQASAVSGEGAAAVPGVTGDGAVAAQASDVDGSGVSAWISSGALVAQASDVDGLGVSISAGSGTAVAQSSAASGTGNVSTAEATGTGALAAQSSDVDGAGEAVVSAITGTGALAAQTADADGAGTISGVPDAWNSADKSANITLSNNDKTATLTAAVTSGVRSTTKYLNGTETQKFYAEFLLNNVVGTVSNQVGLREVSASLTSTAGSTAQCASNSGNILTGNATIIGNVGGSPLVDGDVICMAWTPATERIWFRKNSGLWNNDAAADPATNTNGLNISVLNNTDHALFFLIASTGNAASTTIRTELADLTFVGPSGFVSWMGEALSTPEATGTGALASQSSAVAGAGLSASTGDGATNAQAATLAGTGAVASSGTSALVGDAATVGGEGVSSSAGTGNAVAGTAAVAGTGIAAAANSGALVAQDATVAGDGVSSSDGVGALQANAAAIAGEGSSVSTGSGALACNPVTIEGVGVVLEEGVAVGTGELLAGAATISGEGEVTGEVAVPPVYGGYHYRPDRRPKPVEGYGYGILPQIEGEAHGSVGAVGRSIGALPRFAGLADATVGAAGSSAARLTVKATALGNVIARGKGSGMIVKFQGAAAGRHDDDEAAIVAWLLAA